MHAARMHLTAYYWLPFSQRLQTFLFLSRCFFTFLFILNVFLTPMICLCFVSELLSKTSVSDTRYHNRQATSRHAAASFIHSFIHSCIDASMHPCIHPCIHSSIYLFMHSCIHACMHSFIHPSIHPSIHLMRYDRTHSIQ